MTNPYIYELPDKRYILNSRSRNWPFEYLEPYGPEWLYSLNFEHGECIQKEG